MSRGNKPAYPSSLKLYSDGSGLTIREAFVMAAMQGLCANQTYDQHVSASEVARIAIEQADATLAALEQADG